MPPGKAVGGREKEPHKQDGEKGSSALRRDVTWRICTPFLACALGKRGFMQRRRESEIALLGYPFPLQRAWGHASDSV